MLLGYKLAGGISVVALIAVGYLSYQVVLGEKTIAQQETTIAKLQASVDTLTTSNEQNQSTIDAILTINEASGERISELTQEYNQAYRAASTYEREINVLRQTEAIRMLQEPYERGNYATTRVNDVLLRIAGRPAGSTGESKDNTDDSKGSYTSSN